MDRDSAVLTQDFLALFVRCGVLQGTTLAERCSG